MKLITTLKNKREKLHSFSVFLFCSAAQPENLVNLTAVSKP
jgi:hypothetical protein